MRTYYTHAELRAMHATPNEIRRYADLHAFIRAIDIKLEYAAVYNQLEVDMMRTKRNLALKARELLIADLCESANSVAEN